jgi:hypothetical protein
MSKSRWEVFMKKVFLLVFLFSVLATAFMFGQDQSSPFSWTIKKNGKLWSGDAIYKGKTFDETWAATVKTLRNINLRTANTDKDSGTMTAVMVASDGDKYPFELLIEKTDEGTTISVLDRNAYKDMFGGSKKWYKRILEGVAVTLYGEDVIPKKGKNK